jgi:hypothetical protein
MISGLLQSRFLHRVKHALLSRPGSMFICYAVVTLSGGAAGDAAGGMMLTAVTGNACLSFAATRSCRSVKAC